MTCWQAIGNLVDNAVGHSFENTAWSCGRLERRGVIEVVNEGIRLAPGEETRIPSTNTAPRSTRDHAPGTGIGIGGADIIVQHGGTPTAMVPVRNWTIAAAG